MGRLTTLLFKLTAIYNTLPDTLPILSLSPSPCHQLEKQQAELRAKREEAWARRRALGLVVEGGAEGSRPLFDDRPTPKVRLRVPAVWWGNHATTPCGPCLTSR